jgi:hypothetical protein
MLRMVPIMGPREPEEGKSMVGEVVSLGCDRGGEMTGGRGDDVVSMSGYDRGTPSV